MGTNVVNFFKLFKNKNKSYRNTFGRIRVWPLWLISCRLPGCQLERARGVGHVWNLLRQPSRPAPDPNRLWVGSVLWIKNILNLDPDTEFWLNFDPDPGLSD